jgi:hypothetical protein
VLARVPLDERQEFPLVFEAVGLVEQQEGGLAPALDEVEDEAVAVARRGRRVAYEADEVDAFERVVDGGHHPAVEEVARLVDARRVHQNDLPAGARDDAANLVARRLRLVRHGRNLLAHHPVQKR